ncbi:MAG: phytanoyl-CoA dioxygenase family protein, partial [Gammaproteobacteria bacterium]|nr:phytanoyl-CoA dioxygenase family protein [Gammaproteobacteria bacterium]
MSTTSTAKEQSGLSQSQIDAFQRDGFLLVEDFFTSAELDRFGPAVDAAVAHRTSDDHRPLASKSLYEQTFVQCMRLWEDHPEVAPFTFHPRLCAAAAA